MPERKRFFSIDVFPKEQPGYMVWEGEFTSMKSTNGGPPLVEHGSN